MKLRLLTFWIFLFGSMATSSFAQDAIIDKSKQNYISALQQIEVMLSGKQPLSYQKAIFLTENAWWDDHMDYSAFRETISRDTSIIRTIAVQLQAKPDTPVSKNFWDALHNENIKDRGYMDKAIINTAIFSYLTDTLYFVDDNRTLQHLPFSYATSDPLGSMDWSNTQVLNLLGKGQGNCYALVSLFKIFSECFNSDANIGTAPGHVYITHRDEKGLQYNVEIASKAFPGTGTLATLTHTSQQAIENDISLRELNLRQSICLTLIYLAKGYEHKYGLSEDDGFMLTCANTALYYDSLNLNAMLLKAQIMENTLLKSRKTKAQFQIDPAFIDYQNFIQKLCHLGYREMPLEMKNILIGGFKRDSISHLAYKRNSSINKKTATRQASLSWGLFDEQIGTKPIERYFNTLYDTRSLKVIGFAKEQKIYNNYNFDLVVFALNVDPMAHKYPHASPYNFVENNPISRIDPDGADWILATGNKIYWYGGKVGDKKNLLTVFKATSGYQGPDDKGKQWNLQNSKYQNVRNGGPTAEGKYYINLKSDPNRVAEADTKTGSLKQSKDGGIEQIPAFVANPKKPGYGWTYPEWGKQRAHLEPINVTGATNQERDNNSYYFHDSEKGYTHGCTECETGLFDKLREYKDAGNSRIDVIVDYPTDNHSTNGGTKKN